MKTNYEKLMKNNYEKLLIFYLPFTACHSRAGQREGKESMLSEAVPIRFQLLCAASHRFHAYAHTPRRNDMGGWIHVFFRLKQASTAMSSLRGLVGKGMVSIAVEAVPIRLQLLCAASHRLTTSNAEHFPPTHLPLQE